MEKHLDWRPAELRYLPFLAGRCGAVAAHEVSDLLRRACTGEPRHLFAAPEKYEQRDASDAEFLADLRKILCVDLGKACIGGKHSGRLFELRSHHPAGTTPWRPEINQQGQVIGFRGLVQRLGVKRANFAVCQLRPANPAFRPCRQSINGHAVDGGTFQASDFGGTGHGKTFFMLTLSINGAQTIDLQEPSFADPGRARSYRFIYQRIGFIYRCSIGLGGVRDYPQPTRMLQLRSAIQSDAHLPPQ